MEDDMALVPYFQCFVGPYATRVIYSRDGSKGSGRRLYLHGMKSRPVSICRYARRLQVAATALINVNADIVKCLVPTERRVARGLLVTSLWGRFTALRLEGGALLRLPSPPT